ncbi:MAG: diaminopimelate epimerase [Verrucomicrobiota bacterium]|nr:diaminopimelate epimerase [Verrucomicrobiota bacterium]
MKFLKYHALGNDYLVLDPADATTLPDTDTCIRICHRNFGLGSDGILYGPIVSNTADFALRIINPDGSEAEKSGNGLRIFARYLYDCGKVGIEPFTIDTLGGIVTCKISNGADLISVDMGHVTFGREANQTDTNKDTEPLIGETIEINGTNYTAYIADIGNPHCVIPLKEISQQIACTDGALIEIHPNFPNRTNVQFLKVIDRDNIQIEIWERGAGYTLASGSSSSAAAAIAHRLGLCSESISVHMPGGEIHIEISSKYAIRMSGSVTRVASINLDVEALKF